MKITYVSFAMLVSVWFVICVTVPQAYAYIDISDGQTHDINYQCNDFVRVDYGSPGLQTTVNWLDGASISGGYTLEAYQDSRINIRGGTTGSLLYAADRSQITISGGTVWLGAFGNSHVDISDGLITNADMGDYAQISLHSGSVAHFGVNSNSWLQMSGGTVTGSIVANNTSRVDITGGVINGGLSAMRGQIFIHGGDINGGLTGLYNGVLWIYGSNFAVDGQSVSYGELTSLLGKLYVNEPIRHLTGTLATGDSFDNPFQLGQTSKIMLVPEPTTLLMLGLGGLVLKRRRR